jgi:hypothetical protein
VEFRSAIQYVEVQRVGVADALPFEVWIDRLAPDRHQAVAVEFGDAAGPCVLREAEALFGLPGADSFVALHALLRDHQEHEQDGDAGI